MSSIRKILLIGLVTLLASCSNQSTTSDNGKLTIVATTTMLADLANKIGGEAVTVTGLMGPGIDPHLYQASAGDVIKLQDADVVLYNGLHLEGKMGDLFSSLGEQGRNMISIEDGFDVNDLLEDSENPGYYDPHVWFDVELWRNAAEHVTSELSTIDSDNTSSYQSNLESYYRELSKLEEYINDRFTEIPENQRILVTAHDAFGYLGKAYGIEVVGLQGISTDAEAGTSDVRQLAQFIEENQIKAIFVESSVPPKNIEALQDAVIARGFEVEIGGQLYSDSLGDGNYIDTFRENIDTIVDALK
ncbi:MAG TPA: zinc ABC transporter solute-binding protein [Erysipelothrix sp.]|jgi:manganese/zinc/iron transport system substrate-binding protein|nr:zinc ABC transporter solute-binding protein [Erysipelothrix sp.]